MTSTDIICCSLSTIEEEPEFESPSSSRAKHAQHRWSPTRRFAAKLKPVRQSPEVNTPMPIAEMDGDSAPASNIETDFVPNARLTEIFKRIDEDSAFLGLCPALVPSRAKTKPKDVPIPPPPESEYEYDDESEGDWVDLGFARFRYIDHDALDAEHDALEAALTEALIAERAAAGEQSEYEFVPVQGLTTFFENDGGHWADFPDMAAAATAETDLAESPATAAMTTALDNTTSTSTSTLPFDTAVEVDSSLEDDSRDDSFQTAVEGDAPDNDNTPSSPTSTLSFDAAVEVDSSLGDDSRDDSFQTAAEDATPSINATPSIGRTMESLLQSPFAPSCAGTPTVIARTLFAGQHEANTTATSATCGAGDEEEVEEVEVVEPVARRTRSAGRPVVSGLS